MLAARAAAGAGRASLPSSRCRCPPTAVTAPRRRGVPPVRAEAAGAPPSRAPPPPPPLRRTTFTALPPTTPARSKPLVLLFGWLGCRPRDLDKYSAAWRDLGHETLAVCPSLGPLLLPSLSDAAAARTARAAAVALSAAGRSNTSVIAHVFSNGGFLSAGALLAAERPGGGAAFNSAHPPLALPSRLAGLAFDSCPARLNPDLAARGVAAAWLAEPADGVEARRPGLVGALRPALGAALAAPPLASRLDRAWSAWEALGESLRSSPIPRLFLYSDVDALIPPSEVERFAGEVVGGGGGRVRKVLFPGSPHCEHLRTDGPRYKAALAALAAEVEGVKGVEAA